jgi:hypothetical protein
VNEIGNPGVGGDEWAWSARNRCTPRCVLRRIYRASTACRIVRVGRSDSPGRRPTGPRIAHQHAFADADAVRAAITDSVVPAVVFRVVFFFDDNDYNHHHDDDSGGHDDHDSTAEAHHHDHAAAAAHDDHDHAAVRPHLLLIAWFSLTT